jgi:hypothetical protein
VVTGRIEFSGDANLLLGGRVEAYDRELPSLEQRYKIPRPLAQSPINGETFSSALSLRAIALAFRLRVKIAIQFE